jgi:tetratricopeptide (TPR) repeat protein
VVGIADDKGKLLEYVPFHKINYCDMVRVRVRRALHEVDQLAVDKVDHPDKALMPNAIPGAVARRHVKLGEMFLKSRQWEKAAEQARIAIEKFPEGATGHLLLGRAMAAQGRCPEAGKALDEAQRLDPRSPVLAEARRACEKK